MNEMVVFMMSKLYYIKIHAVAVFSGCVLRYLQTKLLQTRVTYITMSTTNIILTWKWTMEYRFGVLHATSPIRILLIKAGLFKIFLKWKMCNSEPGIRNSELYQTFYLYVQDISVLKLLVYIVYMKVDGTVNSSNKQTILNWNSLIRFLSSLQIIYYFWLELSGIRKESFFIHFQIFQFPAHLILIWGPKSLNYPYVTYGWFLKVFFHFQIFQFPVHLIRDSYWLFVCAERDITQDYNEFGNKVSLSIFRSFNFPRI